MNLPPALIADLEREAIARGGVVRGPQSMMPIPQTATKRLCNRRPPELLDAAVTGFRVMVPVRTVSELNRRDFWTARHRRSQAARTAWLAVALRFALPVIPPPVVVTIVRYGPGTLDDDNLRGSGKFLRDQIAEWLGVSDGAESAATWRYGQVVSKRYGVEVRIESILPGESDARRNG